MSGIAAASGGRPVSPFAPAELARRFGPRSSWEVVPGQVWRAAAGTLGLLVLIVEADVTHARVMPVVPDDELQTDQCWVLEPRLTSFSSVVTVWAGVAVALPYLALDRPIDTWGPPVLDAVLGGRALAGMHRGHAHGDGLDAEGAAELADELEALIAATEIPEVQSPAGGPAFTPSPQQLVALEAATGLPMPEVLAMGLPPAEGWIADAPCANGSPFDHDLPLPLRGNRMLRHNVLADYTVRQALARCADCPYTRQCRDRVAPEVSYYDGVCAGLVWLNGQAIGGIARFMDGAA